MISAALLNRPCMIFHVTDGAVDDFGDPALTADAGTASVCEIQQYETRSSETEDHTVDVGIWQIFLPADAEISGMDYLVVDGVRYDPEGPPWPVYNARTSEVSHIQIRARQTS